MQAAGRLGASSAAGAGSSAAMSAATAAAGLCGVLAPAPGCWVPVDWVDVVEPFVGHLVEVLRRFREDGAWQQHKEGTTKHWDSNAMSTDFQPVSTQCVRIVMLWRWRIGQMEMHLTVAQDRNAACGMAVCMLVVKR